jgi:hypothetical protein
VGGALKLTSMAGSGTKASVIAPLKSNE